MPPQPPPWPSIEAIADVLEDVLKVGVRPAQLPKCEECRKLFELACVQARADGSSHDDRLGLALEAVLKEALAALGDGPYGEAVKLLFGVATDAKGRQLKRRRELAADEFGVMVSTLRQEYEREWVEDLAAEVYRIEFGLP